jgi:hypothetical protein
MTIHMTVEHYQGGDQGEFYTMALTGDTYQAKEAIKGLGYQFSDQVGMGKAWRLPVIFKADMVPGNAKLTAFQGSVTKTIETLKSAGYTVVQHR